MMRSLPDEALLAEYAAGSLPAGAARASPYCAASSLVAGGLITANGQYNTGTISRREPHELCELDIDIIGSDPWRSTALGGRRRSTHLDNFRRDWRARGLRAEAP